MVCKLHAACNTRKKELKGEVEQTVRRGTTFSCGYCQGFCFLLLDQRFSLQSWCVQWSRGSAEGSVLPPRDGQEVNYEKVQPTYSCRKEAHKTSIKWIFSLRFCTVRRCFSSFVTSKKYVLRTVLINKWCHDLCLGVGYESIIVNARNDISRRRS